MNVKLEYANIEGHTLKKVDIRPVAIFQFSKTVLNISEMSGRQSVPKTL